MPGFEVKQFGQSDPALARWSESVFEPIDPKLREILDRSRAAGLPEIAVAPFDGLHLEVLVRALAPKRIVEVGTLGGYSGVCMLRGLPKGGVLHTFELSEKHAAVARESYAKSGFEKRAQIHIGPALEEMAKIESQGPFDLVFIDADKPSYPAYLTWAGKHLRIGGVVLGDNAFAWGGVADPNAKDASTAALRIFNSDLAQGGVFRATMLPTGEGLAMGVKVREP